MPRITSTEMVEPKKLGPEERQALIDGLYNVQSEVFDGVDKSAFTRYVIDSQAEHTWIFVNKNERGETVGYFAFHVYERMLRGKLSAVFRFESGIMRAYRGGSANNTLAVRRALAYIARHPTRPIYYLGSLVHPSSYSAFAKLFPKLYPNANEAPPPDIVAFMDDLATSFGLERVHADNPLVRAVHWITRDSEAEQKYWQTCDKPAARFFVEANPGYTGGDGLLTLIPGNAAIVLRVLAMSMLGRLNRRMETLMAALHRLPIGYQLLRPRAIKKQLKAARPFSRLDETSLDRLAQTAEKEHCASGQYIFRAGDDGDDLFLVVRGAVYVLDDEGGEERIINQLGTGGIFGEIAMLSGGRRSASVRTACNTVLIKVPRKALLPLMEEKRELGDQIWNLFETRRSLHGTTPAAVAA